jgi:catechol 2,3-dioxygenase-like lactoylglutathione lyase family enzyme
MLNHFGVAVSNLERSIAFYSALTGEQPSGRGTWSSEGLGIAAGAGTKATIEWAAFQLGNVNIDLLQVDEPQMQPSSYKLAQPGAMHACFEVDDLEAVFDRMTAAGIEFYGPWHKVSTEEDGAKEGIGVVVAYFAGPDGEHLELIAPTGPFVRKEVEQGISITP